MKHISFYSGGVGSWAMTKRVIAQQGLENVIMLFTDTLIEDKDLYRVLLETTQEITGIDQTDLIALAEGIPDVGHETMEKRKEYLIELAQLTSNRNPHFVWIADGRDPWGVFKDAKWIGNSRTAQCSHKLKQEMASKWIKKHFNSEVPAKVNTSKKKFKDWSLEKIKKWEDKARKAWEKNTNEKCVLYLGIDWSEDHRRIAPTENWHPYRVEFPMCDEPYIDKNEMLGELNHAGIRTPRLYVQNFAHNNCGGFCVRAGQGHFINLLQQFPALYKYHEDKEQEMRIYLDKDVSILRRQKNKIKEYITLKQLREEFESNDMEDIDMEDIGGCGCFVEDVENT